MKERSRLGMGAGEGGEEEPESSGSGLTPLMGVLVSLGLAMVANLENGLFPVSVGGVVRGVVVRDYRQGESKGK